MSASTALMAAGKALTIWFVLYLIGIHCLIAIKWNASNLTPTSSSSSSAASSDDIMTHVETELIPQLKKALASVNEQLKSTKAQIDAMKAAEQELLAQQQSFYNTDDNDNDNNTTSVVDDDDDDETLVLQTPETLKLSQLLQIPSLSELRSATYVSKKVNAAIDELEQQLNTLERIDWNVYTDLFLEMAATSSNNKKDEVEAAGGSCSGAAFLYGGNDSTNSIYNKYATQQDMDQATQNIFSVLFSQFNDEHGLPVSFEETLESIEEKWQAKIQEKLSVALEEIQKQEEEENDDTTTATTNTDGVCLDEEDVLEWMEAGFDALYRQVDIRQALLAAMKEDGIDTSEIILDASDLEEDEETTTTTTKSTTSKRKQQVKQIPLRQLLDTPALHWSASYIDSFLDFITGYHDGLDQFLDQHVWAQIADKDVNEPDVIGRKFTKALLQTVGKVQVPVVTKSDVWNMIQNKGKRV